MTIAWDNRFNIGHSTIDAEHKGLLIIINSIELALKHPNDKETLLYSINLLYEMAMDHFRYEEALLAKYTYQDMEQNSDGHKNLVIELHQAIDEIRTMIKKTAINTDDRLRLREYVSSLANGWLLHLIQEDLKMKDFIVGKY